MPGSELLGIGAAAKRSGCTVQTIRYYEQIDLIPPPTRTAGNQRVYDESTVQRLGFVRHARSLGFGLEAIRELLDLSSNPGEDCTAIDAIAAAHLAAVRTRIASLRALEGELQRMVEACAHGSVGECHVVEVLSDHGLCAGEHGIVEP